MLGVDILEGFLKKGTPLCVPQNNNFLIGRVASIEKDKKEIEVAKRGLSNPADFIVCAIAPFVSFLNSVFPTMHRAKCGN